MVGHLTHRDRLVVGHISQDLHLLAADRLSLAGHRRASPPVELHVSSNSDYPCSQSAVKTANGRSSKRSRNAWMPLSRNRLSNQGLPRPMNLRTYCSQSARNIATGSKHSGIHTGSSRNRCWKRTGRSYANRFSGMSQRAVATPASPGRSPRVRASRNALEDAGVVILCLSPVADR